MALFGKKPSHAAPYLLMSTDSKLLARGELISPPDSINMQINITEGSVADVIAAETVQAISLNDQFPMRLGRVILRRGRLVVLDPLRELSASLRQNLRMPVDFESFVYPRGGGRARIRAEDLSCGGVAFYTAWDFALRERFEIVIPITEEAPLLLNAEVLRQTPYGPLKKYAAQFVDLIHDEEARIREAVFYVQLHQKVQAPAGK